MTGDPRQVLADEPMGGVQVTAVTLCILLCALDGFDVLSISFASPGIAVEWGINRAALGIVLSMELIGMALGSIIVGPLADQAGRRPPILVCLVVMSSGMYLASIASSVEMLSVARFYTGLGIGGMLATINAMAAEFANARHRNLAVSLMATGLPHRCYCWRFRCHNAVGRFRLAGSVRIRCNCHGRFYSSGMVSVARVDRISGGKAAQGCP